MNLRGMIVTTPFKLLDDECKHEFRLTGLQRGNSAGHLDGEVRCEKCNKTYWGKLPEKLQTWVGILRGL